MRQFDGAVLDALDVDSYVICWMALILYIQLKVPHLVDDTRQLLVRQAQEDAIIDIDNKYDITAIENTLIDERLLEVDLLQFVDQLTIPNSTSLFLTIQIG